MLCLGVSSKSCPFSFQNRHNPSCDTDLDKVAGSAAGIFGIEVADIFLKGKQQKRVNARSLFCFWAVHELGISLTELARRLGGSVPGVGYSVVRGEKIARDNDYQLIE